MFNWLHILVTFYPPKNRNISCRPGDYVLATNETHSVREFVEKSFKHIGVEIAWKGSGVNEVYFIFFYLVFFVFLNVEQVL